MAAGVPMTSVGNPGRGLGVKQVYIRSVDPSNDRVLATDPGGVQIELPYNICRAGRYPVAGQTWIVDRSLGFWSLAAYVRPPGP